MENLENIKIEIEKKVLSEDFQALISYLTVEEQEVLCILIRSNSALPIRTIRNYIIAMMKEKNLMKIYTKFGLPNLSLISVPMKEEIRIPIGGMRVIQNLQYDEKAREILTDEKLERKKLALYKHFLESKGDTFKINLLKSLISDDFLLRYSIKPLSFSEKVKFWEKALKGIVDVPSWNVVKTSIENLLALGLIKERRVIRKKAEILYFVSPMVYKIWLKKRTEIQNRMKKENYEPDETEKIWFL